MICSSRARAAKPVRWRPFPALALALFLCASLFPALAVAGNALPTPEEMVSQASVSRADFIDVVGKVEGYAPALPDKNALFPYIRKLDAMKGISSKYEFESLGVSPLENLSRALTSAAVKFLRLDVDDSATVQLVLRWSPDQTRYEIGQTQIYYVSQTEAAPDLIKWNAAFGGAIDHLLASGAKPFVLTSYEMAQALAIERLLKQWQRLENSQVLSVIGDVRTVAPMLSILVAVNDLMLSTQDFTKVKLGISWVLAASSRMQALPRTVPADARAEPGRVLVAAISKLLASQDAPDAALATTIVNALNEQQLLNLKQSIEEAIKEAVPLKMLDFLWQALRRMADRFEAARLELHLRGTQTMLERVALLKTMETSNFEGDYEVVASDGSTGRLVIAMMGDSNFILGLRLNNDAGRPAQGAPKQAWNPLDFSLFHVAFNYRNETFEAHRFAVDDPRYLMPNLPHWWMRFTFKNVGDGISLEGQFSDTRTIRSLKARRVVELQRAWEGSKSDRENIVGIYRGEVSGSAGAGAEIRIPAYLSVSQVGTRLAGTIELDSGAARVPLTYGNIVRSKSTFAITSAELLNGRWVHLRGQVLDADTLLADYVVGGIGTVHKNVLFKRIPNPPVRPEVRP